MLDIDQCKKGACGIMISTTLHAIVFAALVFLASQNHYMHKSLVTYENYTTQRDREWDAAFQWRDKVIKLIENETQTTRKLATENKKMLETIVANLKNNTTQKFAVDDEQLIKELIGNLKNQNAKK